MCADPKRVDCQGEDLLKLIYTQVIKKYLYNIYIIFIKVPTLKIISFIHLQ